MKRRWKGLLALFVLFTVIAAGVLAEDWQNEGSLRWKLEEGVLSIEGSGAIPDYSAGSPAPWSDYSAKITKVVISDGVTGIGSRAFMELGRLSEVVVPTSVTAVGSRAFQDDDALTSVSMPGVVSLGDQAFNGCSYLQSIDLPAAKTVGEKAFDGCTGLKSLNLPSLESAADNAFPDLSGLTVKCPCTKADTLKDSGYTIVLIHCYVTVPAVPATSTTAGQTEGSRCAWCGEWEPGHEPQVIPAEPVREIPVTGIKLNKTKATLYARKGTADTLQLKATVTPTNAKDQRIRWRSSDTKVAKVDQNGLITVVTRSKGTCSITAEAMDGSGIKAKFTMTVKKNTAKLKKLTPAKKRLTLKVGKSATVKIKLKPATVYNNKLKWKSSNRRVAKVTSKGVIKAVKKGKCVITATATDGSGKKATIKVTVK